MSSVPGFGLENLPYGVVRPVDDGPPLEDADTVVMRGVAAAVSFGECRGQVTPAAETG
jgi:hypothetical protein